MDVLQDYEKDTIRIGVKIADTSARTLAKITFWLLGKLKEWVFDKEAKGQVGLKKLANEGYTLDSQLLKDPNLKELSKIMKRYNVGFSAMQRGDSKSYVLFFKAKDKAQIMAAIDEYLAKTYKKAAPDKPLPEKGPERDAAFAQIFLAMPAGKETPSLAAPETVPLLKEAATALPLKLDPHLPTPIDVSFTALEEPAKPISLPPPRSIPKALEKAKLDAKALELAREVYKEMTRQRVPQKGKAR